MDGGMDMSVDGAIQGKNCAFLRAKSIKLFLIDHTPFILYYQSLKLREVPMLKSMLKQPLSILLLVYSTALIAADYKTQAINHVKSCFAHYSASQVKNVIYSVETLRLDRADIANGMKWKGIVDAKYLAFVPRRNASTFCTVY